jgi:hypothetical protein
MSGIGRGGTGVLNVDGKEVARNSMERPIPLILRLPSAVPLRRQPRQADADNRPAAAHGRRGNGVGECHAQQSRGGVTQSGVQRSQPSRFVILEYSAFGLRYVLR